MKPYIKLLSDKLHFTGVSLANPDHITVSEGITAVVGANGAGKTTLANILERGWNFRTNIIRSADDSDVTVKKIEFADIHSLAGLKVEYYQQRYEATMNDEVPAVSEVMGDKVMTERWKSLTELFSLKGVEERKINFLSSGELRKLLIINAIISPVGLLILDNPYIGLDAASREVLNRAIAQLPAQGVNVMLLLANPDDIPEAADSVIPVADMTLLPPVTDLTSLKRVRQSLMRLFDYAVNISAIPAPPTADCEPLTDIVRMENCRVDYGSLTIIDDISWRVGDLQFWALAGPNGSGKSTLLSLIYADNPQAYKNNITLFDRRRGTGESIWDIKRRISFISPEMSLHFHPAGDVATIVAQGLNDTTGVFVKLKPGQLELAMEWLNLLHIEHLAQRAFNTLSSGERQLVMLARTFIKQSRLMILDEPLHALDYARSRAVRAIVNYFAARAIAQPSLYPMSIIFVSHYATEMPECVKFTKTLSARQ